MISRELGERNAIRSFYWNIPENISFNRRIVKMEVTCRISRARLMLFLEIRRARITAAFAKPSLQRWLIWSTLIFS